MNEGSANQFGILSELDIQPRRKFTAPYKQSTKGKGTTCELDDCSFCATKSDCGQCVFDLNKAKLWVIFLFLFFSFLLSFILRHNSNISLLKYFHCRRQKCILRQCPRLNKKFCTQKMVGSDIEIPEVLETIPNDDNPATSIIQEVLENTVRICKIDKGEDPHAYPCKT